MYNFCFYSVFKTFVTNNFFNISGVWKKHILT